VNERIKKIAEQAFLKVNDGSIDNIKIPNEFVKEFAELIVQECASLVENEGRFLKYDKLANKLRDTYGKPD
jgi:hypothetical protein